MTAQEFRKHMLTIASDDAKHALYFWRGYRRTATIPLFTTIACNIISAITPFPFNFAGTFIAWPMLMLCKFSLNEAEEARLRWLGFRQKTLEDMEKALHET